MKNLSLLSFTNKDSIGEIARPPVDFFKLHRIKFLTWRYLIKSLLVMSYLLFICCKVRIEHPCIMSPMTLIPLSLQAARPAWRPGWKSGFSWIGVNKEKQLLYPSNFLTLRQIFTMFLRSTLSFTRAATLSGEVYNKFCKGILPKEADSQLSQVESGSSMNHS